MNVAVIPPDDCVYTPNKALMPENGMDTPGRDYMLGSWIYARGIGSLPDICIK